MAQIDTSQIEGYADMSVEDKLAALEAYTIPDPDYSGYVKKEVFDKTASDAASYKKKLREQMSEDEAKRQKEQEEREELQSKYEKLLRETDISKNNAKLVALGYDEKLALETATAMVDGDLEKVFINQKKHQESLEKKIRADVLRDTPRPTPDGESKTLTLDKCRQMSPEDRAKFYEEHPDEYRELYGGN